MRKVMTSRIGESNLNVNGHFMTILEYRNSKDIDVYFNDYDFIKRNVCYKTFKSGEIICPYEPTVYGIGHVGEGKYKRYNKYNRVTIEYDVWKGMLRRCYDEKYSNKNLTYKYCTVCEEWHNFQNFAEWYDENYYEVKSEEMHLDKDILVKGNKIYSPETCVFVPRKINEIMKKDNYINRGKLPIGVSKYNNSGNYLARCYNENSERINLGLYETPKNAFEAYKEFKENIIKKIADKYEKYIPRELYKSLYEYEVEIGD